MVRGIIAALLASGLLVGTFYVVTTQPQMLTNVEARLQGLRNVIPIKAPIGNITPARDLRGTWVSSLPGKAIELYGQFKADDATVTVYEQGDIELRIDKVEGNTASGVIRMYNLCAWGQLVSPKVSAAIPKTCHDTGFQPTTIRVTGSRLDFGTVTSGDVTVTMQGTFTADLIYGTMSAPVPPYGEVKGLMHLMRKQ